MKQAIIIVGILLLMIQTGFAQKKDIITDTVHVSGNCVECKARIEDAAYIKGVKNAVWDKDTKKLIVTFNSNKTKLGAIETSIAKAGHDAGDIKALPADYKKLPSCCAYKSGQLDH